MTDFTRFFGTGFRKCSPSTAVDVTVLETALGISLPDEYKDFLLWSDGGGGSIGDLYECFGTDTRLSPQPHRANPTNPTLPDTTKLPICE
ncbi:MULTISPECIES: SMI1/KNR4 family protein [Paraburkholderia]|uniref:SMI1/KNR4 family protein n=1 Tax=Paraburkholderia TaxID=1822464 RepID=UPI001CB1D352|nr:SMI1/KNR4 family protein [Paraburkholderia caribensis]CAG9241189.1 hypothetical protein PCAR4_1000021 [Paraburkholderia caribensis]